MSITQTFEGYLSSVYFTLETHSSKRSFAHFTVGSSILLMTTTTLKIHVVLVK